ncbi:MAG: hypothetical protein GX219_03755 [Tissierellia bacterium]|nr:hypothetical protein [Tissierellia bacterium]
MAVEKMKMLNVVGELNYCDDIIKSLILSGKVELVPAISQTENLNFAFNFDDQNIEQTIDLNHISIFDRDKGGEKWQFISLLLPKQI